MITGAEVAAGKGVVDAIMAAFRKAKSRKLKANAEEKLAEAIRELLLANPNLNKVDVAIATAKAASIISNDLFLAEQLRSSVHGYIPARPKPVAKKAAAKKVAKKAPAKKGMKKAVKKSAAAKKSTVRRTRRK